MKRVRQQKTKARARAPVYPEVYPGHVYRSDGRVYRIERTWADGPTPTALAQPLKFDGWIKEGGCPTDYVWVKRLVWPLQPVGEPRTVRYVKRRGWCFADNIDGRRLNTVPLTLAQMQEEYETRFVGD